MAKIMPGICNRKILIGASVPKAPALQSSAVIICTWPSFYNLVLFVHLFSKLRNATAGA